jgi:hypothetical protein
MPIDPNIPLRSFANQPDIMQIAGQAAQMRRYRLADKMQQAQYDEYIKKKQEEDAMRAAAAGAVTPASTQQVNIPGVSLGQYGSTGNQTDSLTTPASFDMQKYQGNVASNPAIAYQLPQIQAQQAQAEQAQAQARAKSQQEQIAIQEGLGRLDAQSRQQVVAATDTIGKAAGAVKMAAPEMKAQVYQSALQALASDPNPMVQKMIQGAPQQYTPQLDGQIDQWITHAMSISDIAERTNPKPSPGVNVPLPPDVQKQKIDIAKQSRVVAAPLPGSGLDDGAVDQAAQLYLQTGQMPALGMGSAAAGLRAKIMNRAAQLNGSADIAANKIDYGGKKSTTTYFTSGAGGKQLNAFNTAITHLDTLDRLAGDLGNHDLQVYNKAAQAWAEATGNPAPANFASAVNAMSGEVAAALKASGATDQEISHVASTFSRSQSPAQLKGAINTYRELLKSKEGQLKKQYESGMQGKPAFNGGSAPKADPLGIF